MKRAQSAAPRRTRHDEHSEETRSRLLEATIESLVEVGYARTSTTEIADRAGVSRGAQVYHYPTKASLVAAAVEHLLQKRHEELQRVFEQLPANVAGPAAALDALWKLFEGPTFAPWLEFVVASRTDPELRAAAVRQSEPFVLAVGKTMRRHLPAIAWNPIFRKPDFLFALLDGLALARSLYPDEDRGGRMLSLLKTIAEQLQPKSSVARRRSARRRGDR